MRSRPLVHLSRWFAWRPVWVEDVEQWVWLEFVWRVRRSQLFNEYFDSEAIARRAASTIGRFTK